MEHKVIISYKEHLALNRALFISRSLPIVLIYDLFLIGVSVVAFITKYLWVGIFILSVMVLYTAFVLIINKYNVKKLFNSSQVLKSSVEVSYKFNDVDLDVVVKSGVSNSGAKVGYNAFYKVLEDKHYIFIFQNRVNAYIVNKDIMNNDEIEYLRNLLKSNVKKYKKILF